MRPSRFTEEQIIGMLKEQEAGAPTADVCRKLGISSATVYNFKAKYGGLDVSDARLLKTLEDENARLKKLLAEQLLDNAILKDVAAKNGDARCEAEGGGSCLRSACSEPASGVPGLEDRSLDGALHEHSSGRCSVARGDEGRGGGAPPVRLWQDPHHAGPPGHRDEPEKRGGSISRRSCRCAGAAAANGHWAPAGPCLCLIGPMRAGASTFFPTRSATVAASGCSPSLTTIRASAWRSSPTPRSRACASLVNWMTSFACAAGQTRSFPKTSYVGKGIGCSANRSLIASLRPRHEVRQRRTRRLLRFDGEALGQSEHRVHQRSCGPHRPQNELPIQAGDPSIVYRIVAITSSRLHGEGFSRLAPAPR